MQLKKTCTEFLNSRWNPGIDTAFYELEHIFMSHTALYLVYIQAS